MTSAAFEQTLKARFSNWKSLSFHMSLPFIGGNLPADQRPRKYTFGSWLMPVLRVLAKGKGLRGGWLDVFGRSAERRAERQLIDEYEQLIRAALPTLSAKNLPQIVALAESAAAIRGFGPIKRAAMERVRAQWADWRRSPPAPDAGKPMIDLRKAA
jgi:indolepyruvate ferredoxin oxidoreductase